ncbi:hypothetical protein FRC20_002190 [Serendipita sp. 405]|nr:hypothetical protein FRC16_006089 [Serendipita sp. 398]KAG8876218.1 hypothetical protein FRC20_002190 [Serendipita sp. 405]
MTFVSDSELETNSKPATEIPPVNSSDATPISNGHSINKKMILPSFTPVIFVEAKEATLDAELDGVKYEPINILSAATPDRPKIETNSVDNVPKSSSPATVAKEEQVEPLDTFPLDNKWTWEKTFVGLENLGNSCFMNSTLQILLHTPALLNIITRHHQKQLCKILQDDKFCFTCSLKELAYFMVSSKSGRPKSPDTIFRNLRKIAPSFRQYRQEDAHEFLRFSIDALQLSAQNGVKEVPDKIATTSWVHRLFGGQFRSRVGCSECGYNSDTFETFLDLSVDVGKCDTLLEMLRKFSVVEKLEGKNKYKCEKCNKQVNALKQITVHKTPQALCIQLKRFTPWGRKLTHPIEYAERLSLQDAMSSGQRSPRYHLYGVVVHAGSTPNSGHYYAWAKNHQGRWARINDDEINTQNSPPLNQRNAYMLFYQRDSSSLQDAVSEVVTVASTPRPVDSHNQESKKRKITDMVGDEEDVGKAVHRHQIASPRLTSTADSFYGPSSFKKPRTVELVAEIQKSLKKKVDTPQKEKSSIFNGTFKLDLRGLSDTESDEPAKPSSPVAGAPSATGLVSPSADDKTGESSPPPKTESQNSSLDPPSKEAVSRPPSPSSTVQKVPESKEGLEGSSGPQQSDPRAIPSWASQSGTSQRPLLLGKQYTSKAKRKERASSYNPYAQVGVSQSKSGYKNVAFGSNKSRKPTGI